MAARQPNPAGRWILGVEIGGTNIRAGLLDREGRINAEARRPAMAHNGLRAALDLAIEAMAEAIESGQTASRDICGVGLAVPGVSRSEEGLCVFSPAFANSRNVQVIAPVEEAFGLAAYMLSDVEMAALGEHSYGAGRGCRHLVLVTLGAEVDGAAILDGQLRLGASEGFATVGHMIVDEDGPACTCGGRGCLEALVGREAIIGRAVRRIQDGRQTLIAQSVEYRLGSITPALISYAAEQGDPVAREVWEETARYLGVGVANLIQLYNPEVVIIGGSLAQAGRHLMEPLQRTVRARALRVPAATSKLTFAELGNDAVLIGTSVLVKQHLPAGSW
jgi:glucokinase